MINKSLNWIRKQLKKLFVKLFGKDKGTKFVEPLLHAAQGKCYVETVSNKADSIHLALKKLYEEDLQKEFISFMRKKVLPRLRGRKRFRLAIDKHEIGYYGKEDSFYIVGTSYGGKSYAKAFEYISVSLLTGRKDERLHLFGIPWHIGQDVVQSVEFLLNAVKSLIRNLEVLQLDRGFHNNELIAWLGKKKIPYLLHACEKKGRIKNLVGKTKNFYKGNYSSEYRANKSKHKFETTLYICKNVKGKDWIFMSSLQFTSKHQPVRLYRNRWQIETNYAINNQNRIMSKSTNYMIRYFYFTCDILIQILWRISGTVHIPFKVFLRLFIVGPEQVIKMKPAYNKEPPP